MSKTEKNKELEELADWLIHEMSEAIDNTINAKYMEIDLDEDEDEIEDYLYENYGFGIESWEYDD